MESVFSVGLDPSCPVPRKKPRRRSRGSTLQLPTIVEGLPDVINGLPHGLISRSALTHELALNVQCLLVVLKFNTYPRLLRDIVIINLRIVF